MNVEEYAAKLVADGAESTAEDDMNEDGLLAEDLHEDAAVLAITVVVKAIRANPAGLIAWARRTLEPGGC